MLFDANNLSARQTEQTDMLTRVWITGFVRAIDRTRGMFYIQQTNNVNHMLPVHFNSDAPLPLSVREKDEIHVVASAVGYFMPETNERGVRITAISYEYPSDEIRVRDAAWNMPLAPGVPTDDFKPAALVPGTVNANTNFVRIVGFIQTIMLKRKPQGDPTLILLIRQHEDTNLAIPVRVYGKWANFCRKKCKIGDPVLIEGEARVKVKERPDLNTENSAITPVDKIPYIHSSMVRISVPEEIGVIPNWVEQAGWLTGKLEKPGADPDSEPFDEESFMEAVKAFRNERINSSPIEQARIA